MTAIPQKLWRLDWEDVVVSRKQAPTKVLELCRSVNPAKIRPFQNHPPNATPKLSPRELKTGNRPPIDDHYVRLPRYCANPKEFRSRLWTPLRIRTHRLIIRFYADEDNSLLFQQRTG